MKYAQRQEIAKQEWVNAGAKVAHQKLCDFIAIALNSPEVMGKSVMSGKKIEKVIDYAQDLMDIFHEAYAPSIYPEADVWQERLDAYQRKIFKDKFVPFAVRYPSIRRNKY